MEMNKFKKNKKMILNSLSIDDSSKKCYGNGSIFSTINQSYKA